jgi:uncharacterized protein (TIGR03382 family)
MKKLLTRLCLAVTMFTAPLASAEADSFGLGTGRDGALKVADTRPINRFAAVTAPLAPGDKRIQVTRPSDFAAGDLVMVLQSIGVQPESASGRVAPLDLSQAPVGSFELARVAAASSDTLELTAPLIHKYEAAGTQVVRVPEYTTVEVAASGVLVAPPWDGQKGGVLAFLAQQTVTNHGHIDASGAGFRGGEASLTPDDTLYCTGLDEPAPRGARKGEGVASTHVAATGRGNVANAGGGGVCLMSGGGGGGHAGAGGQGGRSLTEGDLARNVGGQGGVRLEYDVLNHLVLGGGGGAGHVGITWSRDGGDGAPGQGHHEHGNGNGYGHCKGRGRGHGEEECSPKNGSVGNAGRGGGILFVRAAELAGKGILAADGTPGGDGMASGGSGGGAGGLIYARFAGHASCGAVRAGGGAGGNADVPFSYSGPGGGGGGGFILFQARSSECPTSVQGGNAGMSYNNLDRSNGAERAQDGIVQVLPDGFIVPQAPSIEIISGDCSARPTFAGSTVADGTVFLVLDGREIASVKVGSSGRYSITPEVDLAGNAHRVQVFVEWLGVRSAGNSPRASSASCGPPEPPSPHPPTGPQPDSFFQGGGAGCSATGSAAPMLSLFLLVMARVGARRR